MILFPPAKINLGLHVLFKRVDGFHELETVMTPIPLFDVLELLKSDRFLFRQSGLVIEGNTEDNLCVKAYRLLEKDFKLPGVEIHLRKNIPMGAGLGGGSADAAYVLRGVNDLFALNLSKDVLRDYASVLGSDCPFFIEDYPQLAKGRGELLESIRLDLSGCYLKIINCGIHISTKEAYAGVAFYEGSKSLPEIISKGKNNWREDLTNDFERSVFSLFPRLSELKESLYSEGAFYAAMSGSGSTLFALYEEEPKISFSDQAEIIEKVMKMA